MIGFGEITYKENIMTAKEIWKKASDKVLSEKTSLFLIGLWERWQDEQEYEDFKDYEAVIKKHFSEYKLSKFKKRPISFMIDIIPTVKMKVIVSRERGYIGVSTKCIREA